MPNDYVAPIDHSTGSAFAHTAGGATVGALKTGFIASAIWTGLFAVGGIALAMTGGWAILGGIGLAVGGLMSSSFPGIIAGAIGGISGGKHAHDRVRQERTAAAEFQAQVQIAKMQALAPQIAYANDNKYNFPAQGERMNAANPRIQAGDGVQYDGAMAGQQLATVR